MTGGGDLAAGPFVSFPPRRRNIRVPAHDRRASLAGMALYAPCRPWMLVAHHVGWALVAVLGARMLGRTSTGWQAPTGAAVWTALRQQWADVLGEADGMAVYERPQASRSGFGVLLLRGSRPLAFVKVREADPGLARAARVLAALRESPSPYFHAPAPLGSGAVGHWKWLAVSTMPSWPHRPARSAPVTAIARDIGHRLSGVLDASAAPAHWLPMHGDLTPWNLRRTGLRSLWLLDWEEATWGPPDADAVYFGLTAAVLFRRPYAGPPASEEAVTYWRERIGSRPVGDFDRGLNAALVRVLERAPAAAST